MGRRKGFTLIELMIVIAIIAVLAAIAIPGLLAAQRNSHEKSGATALKTILTAQSDFRYNDRDGNRIPDFWTGDVFGLYGLIGISGNSTVVPGDSTSTELCIKLIELGVASADGASLTAQYGNVDLASSVVLGAPKSQYLFRTFDNADLGGSPTPLRVDTDGSGQFYGAVHHFGQFAVMAFPTARESARRLFIANEDHTIWKFDLPLSYAVTYTPIGSGDSTSTVTGTGQGVLDNVTTYPQAPAAIGGSKLD